jgi:hypothetical protein
MEYLITELKEKLALRRKLEADKVLKMDPVTDREIILLASGKIYELDVVVDLLENMLMYQQQTKKIIQ